MVINDISGNLLCVSRHAICDMCGDLCCIPMAMYFIFSMTAVYEFRNICGSPTFADVLSVNSEIYVMAHMIFAEL